MFQGFLCICCMSGENLVELFNPRIINDKAENYAAMLRSCLNIDIVPFGETSEENEEDYICEVCAAKLRDCVSFKRQIFKTAAILTSVRITDLLPKEDILILGLEDKDLLQQVETREIDHGSNTPEIVTNLGNKPECIFISDKDCHSFNNENLQKNTKKSRVNKNQKARIRRSRKRNANQIPMKIKKGELKCSECGKNFSSHKTLKIHYNEHFSNHVCKTCNKGFMKLASLKKHLIVHQSGPFTCGDCKKDFARKTSLLSHMRMKHNMKLPYPCRGPDCNQRFATIVQRQQHENLTHSLYQVFQCTDCSQSFRLSGDLANHRSRTHRRRMASCAVCDFTCLRQDLSRHMVRRHGAGSDFKCSKCDFKCDKYVELRNHSKEHKERRFLCGMCGQRFFQKAHLQYHIRSHIRKGTYKGSAEDLVKIVDQGSDEVPLLNESSEEEMVLSEKETSSEGEEIKEVYENIDLMLTDTDIPIKTSIEEKDIEEVDENTDLTLNDSCLPLTSFEISSASSVLFLEMGSILD